MSVYFRCGPHLRSDDSAPMHFLEVAVRLVSMLFRPAAGLLDLPQNVIRLVYRRIKRPVSCFGHCGAPVFSTSCREGESTAEVSFRRHSPAPVSPCPGSTLRNHTLCPFLPEFSVTIEQPARPPPLPRLHPEEPMIAQGEIPGSDRDHTHH